MSLQEKFNFALPQDQLEFYVKEEENEVIKNLEAKAQPCVNAMPVLEKLYAEKKYGLAVVSSSALRRVVASVKKVGQDKFFPPNHIFSAATSLERPTTKPDPAIYIHSMKVIGVKPEECVAVEDSKSGALAAIRANIPTIAYVGSYEGEKKQKEIADLLTGLGAKVVMWDWKEFGGLLQKIEQGA